jgi:hypothetical protein
MSIALIPAGTGELTDNIPYFNANQLSNQVGLTASVPVINGSNIEFDFTNTGTLPIKVGVAAYLDQQSMAPVTLSQEIYQGTVYVTVAPNGGTGQVLIPVHCCMQVDAFINMVGTTTVSNFVATFTPDDQFFAGPPTDAGYNTAGAHGSTLPPGALGTLVSYAQTTGGSGLNPLTNNGFPDDCCTPTTLLAGGTATIGFWHNQNGQALIDSLNGGPNATGLSTYLSSMFPALYAGLAGDTNQQVAAYYMTLFAQQGQKTGAQILCTILSAYVTNPTLAGGNYAAQYGFTLSQFGTGDTTIDLGNTLAPFGGPTGVTLISNLLVFVQAEYAMGPPSGMLLNALNTIFSNINQSGDIH